MMTLVVILILVGTISILLRMMMILISIDSHDIDKTKSVIPLAKRQAKPITTCKLLYVAAEKYSPYFSSTNIGHKNQCCDSSIQR